MWVKQHQPEQTRLLSRFVALLTGILVVVTPLSAAAITPIPNPPPAPGSYALVASKTAPPPTTSATISTPSNGANFTTSPITVSGLCTTGLLIEVYDNGVLVGAIDCTSGSFTLQVSLFTGQNDLNVIQYDDLGQASPDSNHVTVFYNNASFSAFGTLITLTSNYGRRAADPGQALTWPLLLSGGTGPYAFSIDWGDGTKPDLKSQSLAGEVGISHVYSQSGIYHVTVKVTDVNGVSAFLQLVAVANGKPTNTGSTSGTSGGGTVVVTKVLWIPMLIVLLLLIPAYWLGRRSELVSLHRKLERDMENYHEL
ncbi:MAG TPA: PKD domain-containing protein [Candidatus Saccharimonadales bacterium]|nr:PKD domain-containing protein [Candidatus Saccharimonadales bacterium]